jgi:hypothetical protein
MLLENSGDVRGDIRKVEKKRTATYLYVNFAFQAHLQTRFMHCALDCQDSVPAASQRVCRSVVLTPVFGDLHAKPGAPNNDATLLSLCFPF